MVATNSYISTLVGVESLRGKRLRVKAVSALIASLLFSSMLHVGFGVGNWDDPNPSIPNPKTLVYLTDEWFSPLEPIWASGPIGIMVISNCYDTLVSYDRGRVDSFRPVLVTEVPSLENGRISPDGLTYRFTLRSDSPLTPEDVEYSFERAMVRGNDWYSAGPILEVLLDVSEMWDENGTLLVSFEDIDNAVEVEGDDVVFRIARIYPPFLHILVSSYASIVSKAWCVEHGDWPGTEETWSDYLLWEDSPESTWEFHYESPLTNETQGYGPFVLDYISDTRIELIRNEDYWRGPARLERVVLQSYSWASRKARFLEDREVPLEPQADICYVPEENYEELEGAEGIQVYSGLPTLQYLSLNFNFAISNTSPFTGSGELDGNGIPSDFFNDIDIRTALAYSIDYDTIISELCAGEALRASSPMLKGHPFHDSDQECYTYDLDRALLHFQQAWSGEVWNRGFNFEIVFNYNMRFVQDEVYQACRMIAELLKNSIEAINPHFQVTVQAQQDSWSYYGDSWTILFDLVSSAPDPGLISFFSEGYNDTTFDSLIEAGMDTVDSAERQVIYSELQRIYHEDVIGVPLVQLVTRHYQRDWVWGWYHNPVVGMDFYGMTKGTYKEATRNLAAHVEDFMDNGILRADAGDSLAYMVCSAIYSMDVGDSSGASMQLNDFVERVSVSELPVGYKDELIALAQEIIEALPSTPLRILMARAFTTSLLVLAGGLFIATIPLLLDSIEKRRRKKRVHVEDPISDVHVSIVYVLLSRLRESRWNIFRRKKESG